MNYALAGKGIALGFSIAAPVGPIGLLCIKRTLTAGRMAGFISGLGAATADLVYGLIAGLGVTAVSGFLFSGDAYIRPIGGILLCLLGLRTLRERPAARPADSKATSLLSHFGSTLTLTLANPMTILSFLAMFAGAGIVGASRTPGSALSLVAGVFFGSAAWWLTLSTAAGFFRDRFQSNHLLWLNRFSGVVIFFFGLHALKVL